MVWNGSFGEVMAMDLANSILLSGTGSELAAKHGSDAYLDSWGRLGRELAELLNMKNGFYAFESALLVRPFYSEGPPLGIVEWNSPRLWKGAFDAGLDDALFFGEDLFGGQFCIRNEKIWAFEPETGSFEVMAESVDAWAGEILADSNHRTGLSLAVEWQAMNGELPRGSRLLPKMPFVCGGKYEVTNLYPLREVEGMRLRAAIAKQIRDVPDGSDVVFTTSVVLDGVKGLDIP